MGVGYRGAPSTQAEVLLSLVQKAACQCKAKRNVFFHVVHSNVQWRCGLSRQSQTHSCSPIAWRSNPKSDNCLRNADRRAGNAMRIGYYRKAQCRHRDMTTFLHSSIEFGAPGQIYSQKTSPSWTSDNLPITFGFKLNLYVIHRRRSRSPANDGRCQTRPKGVTL